MFVEIFKGKVGLLHISEVASHRVKNLDDFKLNQVVEVKVIGIEMGGNRIKLSIKALEKNQKRY